MPISDIMPFLSVILEFPVHVSQNNRSMTNLFKHPAYVAIAEEGTSSSYYLHSCRIFRLPYATGNAPGTQASRMWQKAGNKYHFHNLYLVQLEDHATKQISVNVSQS